MDIACLLKTTPFGMLALRPLFCFNKKLTQKRNTYNIVSICLIIGGYCPDSC
jgi:hypothetical protein